MTSEARSSRALLLLGLLLIGLIVAGWSLHRPGAPGVGSEGLTNMFIAILGIAGVVYLLSVGLVLRRHRLGLVALLLVAGAMRVAPLLSPPFLSSDMYRYVWDGRVQMAGINPYLFIPADPALAALRDSEIYPNINRRDYAHTIYPPMAEAVYQLIGRVSSSVLAMKAAMVMAECVGLFAILRLLDRAGLPRERLLIYAWNPLPAWDYAGNGHVDALAIGFVGLALLARGSRRDGWAGLALGAAVLVKFLPAAIAPALYRRWGWRMPAACIGLIVLLYAAYSGAGTKVLGFLPNYTQEEGLAQGGGFWLLAGLAEIGSLPAYAEPLYIGTCLVLLAALAAWIGLRLAPRLRDPLPDDDLVSLGRWTAILAASLIFAISPHYPWYYPWLALPCCLCPLPSVIFLAVAPLLLYLDPLHDHFVWPALIFVPFIVLAVRDIVVARAHLTGSAPHVRHV